MTAPTFLTFDEAVEIHLQLIDQFGGSHGLRDAGLLPYMPPERLGGVHPTAQGDLFAVAADYVAAYQQAGQALLRLARTDEAREVLRRGIAVAQQQGNHHAGEEMQGLLASLG